MPSIGSTFNRLLQRPGFRIAPLVTTGVAPADEAILKASLPYTMTSAERILAVIDAVRYVVRAGIPGALVECGGWSGRSQGAARLRSVPEILSVAVRLCSGKALSATAAVIWRPQGTSRPLPGADSSP